jgi:signal transduction histidine kinase
MRGRSLRVKLTLWYFLVFSIIQLVLVGGVVLFRQDAIRTSLDADLAKAAELMVDNVITEEVWTEADLAQLMPAQSGFVLFAIRDQEGSVLTQWNVAPGSEIPFGGWEKVPAGPVVAVFTTVSRLTARELTSVGTTLRMVTIPFRRPDSDKVYYLQAAVRDEVLERLLGPFFLLVVIGVPAGMILALHAAWVIAGRAVAPVNLLVRAAKNVSPTSLSERIQVDSTDDEISRLQTELNSALERLEAGFRAQDQFISNVSHELRTPIAVLLTETQVMKLSGADADKSVQFTDRVEEQMQRLGRIVESFLNLTRAELGKHRPMESVSINDVVLDSVRQCSANAGRNDVPLAPTLIDPEDGQDEPRVRGDADLLRTMFDNLLRNAIRHSPAGSAVDIRASQSNGELTVTVRDRGPGIPEEFLERVFDRFVQVPGQDKPSGTGLGLAIANNVAQLHSGRISVKNFEDSGCAFTVTLPVAPPDDSFGAAEAEDQGPVRK